MQLAIDGQIEERQFAGQLGGLESYQIAQKCFGSSRRF
jgi:hypothetical protein